MDDDYDNYSGDEEFNEDSLTNEEYDALYAALPKVKAQLVSYNSSIEDLDIKESLYYNYFEVAAAIEELKSKFPKKKDDAPPKLSKLAMLAKSRAGANGAPKSGLDLSGFSKKTPANPGDSTNISESGKLSRLAALAKSRAKTDGNSGLDNGEGVSSGPNLSKLGALARAKSSSGGGLGQEKVRVQLSEAKDSEKTSLSRKTNGGGLELRRRLENAKKLRERGPERQTGTTSPETAEPMDIDPKTPGENGQDTGKGESLISTNHVKRSASQLSFELSVDSSRILACPQNCVSVTLFEKSPENEPIELELRNKRRRFSRQLFSAYTNREPNIAKARSNFSSPSPDDRVLEAQKQAFEQSVNDLSIKDEKKPEQKPVQPKDSKPFKKIDVAAELAKNPNFAKPSESFVIIGHVDAGKSTLMGRILYDLGTVDAKTVNKLVREAEKSGKGSFALAWVMDQTAEERSRGVTIDICATTFETKDMRFTAIDAPGHKDFVPQMIGGVSQANTALLVVDAITGEFEAGFLMDGQTKEHAIVARNLGIEDVVVAVNKLDKEDWSEARYEDIKTQLGQFLASDEIGFKEENLSFVPISGLTGCNVVKNGKDVRQFAWYSGPTLIERLEQIGRKENKESKQHSLESLFGRDFHLAINDIYDVSSSEFKVKGKISSGMVQPGETICIHPSEDSLQVQAVLFNNKPVNVAVEGQIVSLVFKVNQLKHKKTDDLAIGDIASSLQSAVRSVKQFRASINTFNMSKPLLVGTPFVLFRNNASVAARITKVIRTNGVKKKKMHLVSRQNAEVVVEILEDRRLPVARFEDNKALGRVVLRREGVTVGAGVVTGVDLE